MRRVVRFGLDTALVAMVLLAVAAGAPSVGAEPRRLTIEPTPTGEAYLEAVTRRSVSTDADYYDPTQEAPPLQLRGKPPEPDEPGEPEGGETRASADARWIVVLIATALLAAVMGFFLKFGGTASVSFSGKPDQRRRPTGAAGRQTVPGVATGGVDMSLAEISRIDDPREAIVVLGRLALRHAADANGLGVGRSWTIRDVLRRLPRDWPHLPALYSIARAAEVTHYGGRDLDVHELGAHIEAARPIFDGGRT